MKFMRNKNDSTSRVHIWEGSDTICKLVGDKVFDKDDYEQVDMTSGRKICRLCGDPDGLSNEFLEAVVKQDVAASRRARLELERRNAPWKLTN